MNKVNIHEYSGEDGQGIDMGDTVVHVCSCGNNVFKIFATFDDYEIASYSTDAECIECHSIFKAPTPIDRPGYIA